MRKISTYFPETGPHRRELYAKHMRFFAAGKTARERCSLSANRVGKTESLGGYELVCHLTGEYPAWWPGRTWDRPVLAWACGDTGKTVRDILQAKLMGPEGQKGEGLIPGELILDDFSKQGVANAIELVYIRHKSGGVSTLVFKSYDQGRIAFQGNEPDIILEDEEAPAAVHHECVTRTMTNNGMVMVTYTPLQGLTETVLLFAPGGAVNEGVNPDTGRYVINITWDDVPHLTEEMKQALIKTYPPYMRDARTKGLPQLGAGAIYPVPESEITVPDFFIPHHWPRGFGLDVGWNFTAAIWGAQNPADKVVYLYSVYKQSHQEPSVHTKSIKERGDWIPGVIDPASRGRNQKDGEQLIQTYRDLGLDVTAADNTLHAALDAIWEMYSGGMLKVFASLAAFFSEYRIYRRDEKGNIVKDNDHVMDAKRYLINSGLARAIPKPITFRPPLDVGADYGRQQPKPPRGSGLV